MAEQKPPISRNMTKEFKKLPYKSILLDLLEREKNN